MILSFFSTITPAVARHRVGHEVSAEERGLASSVEIRDGELPATIACAGATPPI